VDALSDGVDHVHVLNNSTTGFNVTADSKKVGNIDGTGNTSVSAGATVILTANHIRQNALTVSGAAVIRANGSDTGTSKVAALTIPAGGNLDLKDNKLIIPAGGSGGVGSWNGSNYDGVTGMIKSGRNGGSWTGSGIVTSMAAAAPTSTLTNLAVVAASDVGKTTFGGQMVSPTDVLVMYTWIGDANLSGKIDADDYFQIDSHANKSADSAKSWFNGDFNYDGKINGDDYFLIDNAFAGQAAPFSDGTLPDGVSSVPEPAMGMELIIVAATMMRRRRRTLLLS
jgi:hypothetical protein